MGRNHLPGGDELKAVARPTISETQNDGMGFGLGFSVVLDPAAHEDRRQPGRARLGRAGQHRVLGRPGGAHHARSSSRSSLPSSTYPLRSQLRQLVYQALVD